MVSINKPLDCVFRQVARHVRRSTARRSTASTALWLELPCFCPMMAASTWHSGGSEVP